MRKKQILVDGTLVSVYSFSSDSFDREGVCRELSEGELAVVLYPEREEDFGVLSFDKNNIEPREPYLTFAALSCFFERVLGFPKMTLDIKRRGETVELPICSKKYKFSVNGVKSKMLCTKTVKFADGIEICVYSYHGENVIAVVACRDSGLFSYDRLTLLLSSLLEEGVSSAIAVSYTDKIRIKSVGKLIFYDAIRAGVSALSAEGERLSDGDNMCEIDGVEHSFSVDKGKLVFYPEINLIG